MLRLCSALALASVAACTTHAPTASNEPRIITQEMPYRPGTGVVQTVKEVGPDTYRLGVRMNNGTMQYIDTDSREVMVGSQIELSPGREIRKL